MVNEAVDSLVEGKAEERDEANVISLRGLINVHGKDSRGRPIVVIDASVIPGPKQRFIALEKIKEKMESVVSTGDYVIVFVMSPKVSDDKDINHKPVPAWWCLQVYRSKLPWEYKKNVKRIVIVHPTFFINAVLLVLSPFLSVKGARKLVKVSQLAHFEEATGREISLEQVRLPPHAYAHDRLQASANPFGSPRGSLSYMGDEGGLSKIEI